MATQEVTFTKGALDKTAHAGGAATRYRDARYPNLYLEVGARSKTWRYRKFWKGQNFTETLGTWPQMTVFEAAQRGYYLGTLDEFRAAVSRITLRTYGEDDDPLPDDFDPADFDMAQTGGWRAWVLSKIFRTFVFHATTAPWV